MNFKIKFKKEDFWVGLYWDTRFLGVLESDVDLYLTKWYLCIIPCFPICWTTTKRKYLL
jgi:hypothetical protein